MKKNVILRKNRKPIVFILMLFYAISLGMLSNGIITEAAEADKVLITPTADDLKVIPDKYNTGYNGEISAPTMTTDSRGNTIWTLGDIILVPSGSGDSVIRVLDFHYRNKEVSGEVSFDNIDFSDKGFNVYNDGLVERKIHLVFNNCKFLSVSAGRGDSNITYEFNNCTFRSFYGSNATFNHCKFGGSYSDGMVPFRNVKVNDCYFSDMTHMATGGEVHTDGTQIYGDKNHDVYNIHFSNCRFEMPALTLSGSNAYINACIMLQLEFSSGSDISFRNCIVNGGSNSVYAWSTKGDWGLENVEFDGLRLGNGYLNGLLDSRISPVVDFKNLRMSDDLYVSSVWQDENGTHLSVTNDSARDRELLIYTDKGVYSHTIEAFDKPAGKEWNVPFDEMPFDEEIIINDSVKYVVCFSQSFPGYAKQIRFVNFEEENDVYIDKSILDELTAKENDILLSGNCGKNISFTLTYGGVLTLSGTGATYNYHSQKFPEWYVPGEHDYRNCVKEIIVEEGIEVLGSAIFAKCNSVEKVTLPNSLSSLGQYAFDGCICLDSVTLPANLEQLGTGVFRGMQLKEIYYKGTDWEAISLGKGNDVLNNNVKYDDNGVITYRVVYALNDDEQSPAENKNPLTFSTGDKFTFTDPQREGFSFDGWFSDSKFIKEIKGLDGSETNNVRVYAKWTENTQDDSDSSDETPDDSDDTTTDETPGDSDDTATGGAPDSSDDSTTGEVPGNSDDSTTDKVPGDNDNTTTDKTPGDNDNTTTDKTPGDNDNTTTDKTPSNNNDTTDNDTSGSQDGNTNNDTQQTISGVQFTNQTVTLKPGKKINNIKYVPKNTKIIYTSSNKKVATVTNSGVVKAINAGQATITAFAGDIKTTFTVQVSPKKTTGIKLKKSTSSSLKISWKKDKNATGYQVMMKTGSKGTYKQIKLIKKNKTVSYTKKKLKKGNVYFVKVRAYKKINNKKIYGPYSKIKKIKL